MPYFGVVAILSEVVKNSSDVCWLVRSEVAGTGLKKAIQVFQGLQMLRYPDAPLLKICSHLSKNDSSSNAILVFHAPWGTPKHEPNGFLEGEEGGEARLLQLQGTVAQPLEACQGLIKVEPLLL